MVRPLIHLLHPLILVGLLACGSNSGTGDTPDGATGDGATGDTGSGDGATDATASHRTVIVIPLENKSTVDVYNAANAPYINGLLATAAWATKFTDELPSLDSEPHYIWMEAGTNQFSDRTFSNDNDASMTNSTASSAHLSTQLDTAGLTWTAYQEGMTAGSCPTSSSSANFYAAKHSPFIFFRDVSGTPPSPANTRCASHYAPLSQLATDLAAGNLPSYAFVTPNLCNDMHGDLLCPSGISAGANVKAGDDWLAANLPAMIAYTHTHDAVIMLSWDEGNSSNLIPFVMIGDHVVAGMNAGSYTHSSQLATIERLLGVPKLPSVASATDFAAMFQPGYLP